MSGQRVVTIASVVSVVALGIWAAAQPCRWQVIGAYRTGLAGRTAAQVHNLRLAAKAINGKVLQPASEFSFNRAVGSWSADRGYVKAPVSYDGELRPAWGGGVCQVSSTLYNAALLAGLEIVERHRHRFPAHYVPPGQDAAVAQLDIDLRFRNSSGSPVKIEAEVTGDEITCRILSRYPLKGEISIEREIRQVTPPQEVIRTSESGSDIRWRVINHGQPGLSVTVYRRITEGSRTARSLVSEDTYPPMNRLVEAE